MDGEKMGLGQWLGLVFSVPFSAYTLTVGWQKGYLVRRNPTAPILPWKGAPRVHCSVPNFITIDDGG